MTSLLKTNAMFTLHSRIFAGLAVAGGLIGTAAVSTASAAVDVSLNIAPPEERVEVVPGPRRGYMWSPGYWEWRGRHHFWVPGHWVRPRTGYHWYRDRWDRYGDRWVFYRGHWERD